MWHQQGHLESSGGSFIHRSGGWSKTLAEASVLLHGGLSICSLHLVIQLCHNMMARFLGVEQASQKRLALEVT